MGSGFLAAIASLARPMVARVLMALGMSVVTVTGVGLSIDALKGEVLSALGSAPVSVLQLVGLSGMWVALGMVFGAFTWCVSFYVLTRATSIVGAAS